MSEKEGKIDREKPIFSLAGVCVCRNQKGKKNLSNTREFDELEPYNDLGYNDVGGKFDHSFSNGGGEHIGKWTGCLARTRLIGSVYNVGCWA